MPHKRFDAPARRWVPGEGPVDVHPLAFGLVNDTCRVTRAGRMYSLRIAAADGQDLGLDRRWECAVRERAGAAGLAPPMSCCRPDDGILVAEWATGRAWSADEARLPGNIEVVARLLRRVHALQIPEPARRMDPAAWIAHYRAALSRRGQATGPAVAPLRSDGLRHASEAHLATLGERPAAGAVLCHSDLHLLNLLIGDRPVLLDWEYAHVSDGFWDLAGWVANNDWATAEAGLLLERYLERPVLAADLHRLRIWGWLYDYVCLMWCELYSNRRAGASVEQRAQSTPDAPDAPGAQILARAEFLANRLARDAVNAGSDGRIGGRAR